MFRQSKTGTHRVITAGALLAAVTTSGCDSVMQWDLHPGVIHHFGSPARIHTPERFTVGVADSVVIITFGGGCLRRGLTDVFVTGTLATIQPLDSTLVRAPAYVGCTRELRGIRHTAWVTFHQPGEATIRFVGREEPSGGMITIVREVPVQ